MIVVKHRAHLSVGRDSRRISAIGWLIYRMYISTIIVHIGSSTVLAIGLGRRAYQL